MYNDIEKVKRQFQRSMLSYSEHAVAQKQIAERLVSLATKQGVSTEEKRVLEIGCGTGFLTQGLVAQQPALYFLNDLNGAVEDILQPYLRHQVYQFLAGDVEQIELPKQVDQVYSSSCFQWLTDLPQFLKELTKHITPGGYLFFSTFGKQNLKEIRRVTHSGLSYYSKEKLVQLLPDNVELLFSEEEEITLPFASVRDVLLHLKRTGVNGNSKAHWSKQDLSNFCTSYSAYFSEQTNVELTYHPIYLGLKIR